MRSDEDERYPSCISNRNLAPEGVARQSCPYDGSIVIAGSEDSSDSTAYIAEHGNDGLIGTCDNYFLSICYNGDRAYWEVDLASKSMIYSIGIYPRLSPDWTHYLDGASLQIYDGNQLQKEMLLVFNPALNIFYLPFSLPIVGDRVRLQSSKPELTACEVEVIGIPLDECGNQTNDQNIDGITSDVLDGEYITTNMF